MFHNNIHYLLLLFWIPKQIPSLFFLSTPTSLVLLLLLFLHLFLQTLFLCLLKILLLFHIPLLLFPDLPKYSPSKHLLILLVHITRSTRFVSPLLLLLSSFLCIVCMLLWTLKLFQYFHQMFVVWLFFLPQMLFLLLVKLEPESTILQAILVAIELRAHNLFGHIGSWYMVVVRLVRVRMMVVVVLGKIRYKVVVERSWY